MKKMILSSLLDGLTGRLLMVKPEPLDVEEPDDAVLQPVQEHDREQAPAEEENPEERDQVDDYQEKGGYRQREHAAMIAARA